MRQCYKTASVFIMVFCFFHSLYGQSDDSLSLPPNFMNIIPALNFKDTDIRDVLRSIALEYETNIVIENQVSAKISTTLFKTRVIDAIRMITEDNGFEFSHDANRFFVRTKRQNTITSVPVPEIEPKISYINGKLNVSLNNNDLSEVVSQLREVTRMNFLVTPGTSGKISGTLENIDLHTGLSNILQNNGYYLIIKDSIFYISRSAYFSSLENTNDQTQKSPYWVSARHNKVTLDVNQIPLDRILEDLCRQLNLQMIKLAQPTANVTVRCSEVSLETALNYLFKGTDFTYLKDGKAYIIGNKSERNLNNTKLIRLDYLRADKVKETLPAPLIQALSINISIEHNGLIVSGQTESISNFEDYIEAIDQPVPQVLIEALVIDYNLDKMLQMGLTAGKGDSAYTTRANKYFPGLDATISGYRLNQFLKETGSINLFGKEMNLSKLAKLPDDFYLNLKALEQKGVANIRSKPLLSSLNGHTASLKIGTVQNYVFNEIMPVTNQLSSTFLERERIEKIEASISFEITPWIGPNNELTLEIKPEFQTPVGQFVPDKKLIPAINTRSFLSTVRLRDGETIILGGLIQESETNTENRFPLLSDIPFLGKLFTNVDRKKSKGELVIYITPKIQYGDDFGYLYYNYEK